MRKASDVSGAILRGRIKPAVRRGIGRIEPLDRAASRASDRRRRVERLAGLYEALRRSYRPDAQPAEDLPDLADVEAVEKAAVRSNHVFAGFFRILTLDGEVDRAAVTLTRRLIDSNDRGQARSIAQALQQYDDLRPIADICVALCAVGEPMPETAWELFRRNDLSLVLRFAPGEYFRLAFGWHPETAAASMTRVLDGEVALEAEPQIWLNIAYQSFAAGDETLSARTLDRAEELVSQLPDPARAERLSARARTLRQWYGRAERAAHPEPAPDGEIPFAVIDYKHPDWRAVSRYLGDATQTLAAMSHVVRYDKVRFTGDGELTGLAERLQREVESRARISGEASVVRLYSLDRDASRYAVVPDGTWTIISEWFANGTAGERWDMPLNPALRPIFIGFHTEVSTLSSPGAIDYLRRYAPIGCLDWDSVHLLQAAGIPAFHSGPITATLNLALGESAPKERPSKIFVEMAPEGPGERRNWHSPDIRNASLSDNVSSAARTLREYQGGDAQIVTPDRQCYVATRAVGGAVDFRPSDVGPSEVSDLARISDADFEAMRRGQSEKLAAVLEAVLAGRADDEVYAVWRDVCAPAVEAAEARLRTIGDDPRLSFDVPEVCAVIRAASVTIERTETSGVGEEINLEFSLDSHYKHQLDIVLDSIVARTSRPIRAFVLCREHGPDDFARMAKLFPTVSFMWLPTDNVDYGRITGMNRWVTPATMDRTVLPVLLPEIERILHFDLDALCLTDLAELYDVSMDDVAIAAATEPQPHYVSGFQTFRRSASRVRREGKPDLADDLIRRTHSRHRFDFDIFNAGIMVLNLAQMRADDFCGKYLPFVQVYGFNGQVVLNAYVGGGRKDVGGEWNRLMRLELPRDVKIAHWAGPYKPWRPHQYVTGRELWREAEERFAERVKAIDPTD